jgi:nucleoside-diphosphate-sugar epimerase
MSERVLITGATGFVGSVLCEVLGSTGYRVRAAVRSQRQLPKSVSESVVVGDIGSRTDWSAALDGVDAVVHLAARVHVMHDAATNAQLYLETNALGTANLAAAAVKSGVRRFVYLSSVKVNGEETTQRPYSAQDPPQPLDDYGISKWRAEQALHELAAGGSIHCSIVRPTLVYGPGVRANFLRLMKWVDKGIPLPLGAVNNRRSLVNVWNLCDLVRLLLKQESLSLRTWMVCDGEDLATPELIRRIAHAMGRRARLPSIPLAAVSAVGTLLGKGAEVRRLCGSLVVDMSATRNELGWSPPISVDEALHRTVSWYLAELNSRAP